jgi:hypothetical protein
MELHQQAKLQTAHLPQARSQCLQVWQFILVFHYLFRHRRQNFSTELQICIGLGIIYCLWLPPTSCPETFLSSSSGSPEASPSPSWYILPDMPKDLDPWFLNLNLFYGASHMPNLYVYTCAGHTVHDFTSHPNHLLFLMWHSVLVGRSSQFAPKLSYLALILRRIVYFITATLLFLRLRF